MVFENFWAYAALALTSLINILIPISGSATVTPFFAILTDPHCIRQGYSTDFSL